MDEQWHHGIANVTMKKNSWILLILLVIFVTRSTTFFTPLIDDEEAFAVFARVLLHGGLPYVSVVDNKPPLVYYFYTLWFYIFGDGNMLAVHIIAAVWVAVTCYVIYLITKEIYSPSPLGGEGGGEGPATSAPYLAALSYAVFTTTFKPTYLSVNSSLLLALPLSLSVWMFCKWLNSGKSWITLLSGVMCTTAALFKYQALVQVPFLLVMFFYVIPAKAGIQRFRSIFFFLLGALLPALAVVACLYFQGTLKEFYQVTLSASMSYIQTGGSSANYWGRAVGRTAVYILATLPLWWAAINQLRLRMPGVASPYSALLWGWVLTSIPAITVGGRFFGHYFIQVLPPLCIIAGAQFAVWRHSWKSKLVVGFAILSAVGWMVPRIFADEIAVRFGFHGLKRERAVATYIKEHLPKGEKIFVWGVAPSIYFLSGSDPATRLLWADLLTGRAPGLIETQKGATDTSGSIDKKSWDDLNSDFEKYLPYYIVDTSSGDLRDYAKFPILSYPIMRNIVSGRYTVEATIEGVNIYRRR